MRSDFTDGLFFWIRGWTFLLGHRSLVGLALLPLVLAIGIVALVGVKMFAWVSPAAHVLATLILGDSQTSSWLTGMVYYPLLVGAGILVVVASVVLAYLLQALLAVPFNGWLAERTLKLKAASSTNPVSAWHMFRVGLVKTMIFLVLGVILFVLAFVPIINIAALTATLLLLAFDFLDYGFEAKRWRFRQRIRFVFARRWLWLGMASALALTMLVPGLTLLIAPGAVVGGALLIAESAGRP